MLSMRDLNILACPACRQPLEPLVLPNPEQALRCTGCGARFGSERGLCQLYQQQEVRGADRVWRLVYNLGGAFHDPAVKLLLPLCRAGTEGALREQIADRLELDAPASTGDEAPLRVLEVSVGTGANLPVLRRRQAHGRPFELWGCDLSTTMLSQCQRRLRDSGDRDVRLLMADAHALPFQSHVFDRVFHVGGINGFRDPARALEEFARVARPGSPIVVVDEQLDPSLRHRAFEQLVFRAITFYGGPPHSISDRLPRGAFDLLDEQISRFYYLSRFKVKPCTD